MNLGWFSGSKRLGIYDNSCTVWQLNFQKRLHFFYPWLCTATAALPSVPCDGISDKNVAALHVDDLDTKLHVCELSTMRTCEAQ